MNQLKLRSDLISSKYRLDNYDDIKKQLEQIYKIEVSDVLVEYLIKQNKDIDELSKDEKRRVFVDFFNSKKVKDLNIVEDEKSITFSFLAKPPENLSLTDDVKIVVILDETKEE